MVSARPYGQMPIDLAGHFMLDSRLQGASILPSQPEVILMTQWPPKEYEPILTALGSFLYQWNELESIIQNTIVDFAGKTPAARILAAHLGSVALCDAIAAIANECLQEPVRSHILHAATMVDRVRQARNHYIHGFRTIGGKENLYHDENGNIVRTEFLEPMGWVQQTTARKTLKSQQRAVYLDELKNAATQCQEAKNYLSSVLHAYRSLETDRPVSWPEKPSLPVSSVKWDQ